jgi:4-amino-4-deoxy-L-arabinose transferase-like glycosyltransferase
MWLSFHDAPPLVFLIQHSVFRVFGDTALTARVPFAVAGVMTLVFVMVLAHSLYGTRVALWAGLALAFNPFFIWTSRIGMLEGIELMWIVAALVCFVRARTRPQFVLWWGAAMGLAFISKYTSLYLIPVFGGLWWRARASLFAVPAVRRRFIAALAMIIIFCAPVIIYNASMWRTRGHLDVQFARLFLQDMSDWSNLDRGVGKNPFSNAVNTANGLREAMPLILLLFAAAGILCAAQEHFTKKRDHSLLLLNIVFLFLLFVFVSPATRYRSRRFLH